MPQIFIMERTVHLAPVDTGRKLNVHKTFRRRPEHKTFRRRPGHLLNVLCTFNLRPVSTGASYTFFARDVDQCKNTSLSQLHQPPRTPFSQNSYH